jgi:uncharacterized protein YbjT (DUF2867 family)
MKYAVTGATGNTGKVVAERLIAAGHVVKAISRSEEHLSEAVASGAIPLVGDLNDGEFLKEAFNDTDGVYAMIPPKFDAPDFRAYQRRIAENIAKALEVNAVPYVVSLSSFGAHAPSGLGVVSGLHPLESLLNGLPDTHVVHLRAGYFFDNLFASIPVIKDQGIMGGFPISGDVSLEMVFTPDIGNAAADRLINTDFEGKQVVFLSHANTHTLEETTKILGKAIGKPELSYISFPPESAKQAMMGFGMSQSLAENYLEFSRGVNEGKLREEEGKYPKQNAPTSLEDFAGIFAGAYARA